MTDKMMTAIFLVFMVLCTVYMATNNSKLNEQENNLNKLEKRAIVIETILGIEQCRKN